MEAGSSSPLSSAISIGTAEARPLTPYKPHVTDVPGPSQATPFHLVQPLRTYGMPSPPPGLAPISPVSQGTMHHLRCRPGTADATNNAEKRRSIIDPSTIRLSFVGSISDVSQPMMPLEEGFQKLYKLYEQYAIFLVVGSRINSGRNSPESSPLPHEVQITDVPLTTIADTLEQHIQEQNNALLECAENITNLHLTNDATKQELISLEFQYCLARQEVNMRSLTSDDVRLRLEWMRSEIERLNVEKEKALQEGVDHEKEKMRLRKELEDVYGVKAENRQLKESNLVKQQEETKLKKELEEVKKKLDEVQFAMRSVPSPVQRICARLLVPEGRRNKENGRLLIPNWGVKSHDTGSGPIL